MNYGKQKMKNWIMIQTLQLQTFQVIIKLMTQEVKTDFANINMLTSLIVLTQIWMLKLQHTQLTQELELLK